MGRECKYQQEHDSEHSMLLWVVVHYAFFYLYYFNVIHVNLHCKKPKTNNQTDSDVSVVEKKCAQKRTSKCLTCIHPFLNV